VTRWQAVYRWIGAVVALGVLVGLWYLAFGRDGGGDSSLSGEEQSRRIDVVVDLGTPADSGCSVDSVEVGAVDLDAALTEASTGCVLVGSRSDDGALGWFFVGRATGNGTVRVPRPVEVGQTRAALSNGAVVLLGDDVRVRCTADPNARYEIWIAEGLATAGYLDPQGRLVGIDCSESQA
jgi:hypothetical protein